MTGNKGLKKDIGLFTLVSIGVGSVIGSGIFALPAIMAAVAGPGLILAIILSGIITTFLAIAYAELGSAYPLTGGPYALPRLALGDTGGFIMGWGYFFYLFIGTAAIIDIFVVYLGFYVPGLAVGETLTPYGTAIAVSALWVFTAINILGVKWGALYSVVTTIGKMIPLILFSIVGLMYIRSPNFTPFMPFGFAGVTLAVTLFFWSFAGFETVVVPSQEVRKPSRTIPWAMILTMAITMVAYVFLAFIFVGMIDWKGLHMSIGDWAAIGKLSSPLSTLSIGIGLPWLAAIATVGAIIATAGAGGSFVLVQGRLPFAMAEDDLFWKPMANVNPRFGTPVASLIFTSILTTIVMIAIPNFPSVALIASVTAIVPYSAAVLGVMIMRKRDPETNRPFRLPFAGLITLVGFVLATFLIYWASWPWTLVGTGLMLLGYPAFLLIKNMKMEVMRNAWIPVYMIAIVIVSFLGDPEFAFQNFTPWKPLGVFKMPYDLIALTVIAVVIYFWAYWANTKYRKHQ